MKSASYYAKISALFALFAVTFPPFIICLLAYRVVQCPIERAVHHIAFSRAA